MTSPLDSPAFRRWFGDSKVVDARGEPMVVYHGTPAPPFSEFAAKLHGDTSNNQVPFGIHFAEDIAQATIHGPGSEEPLVAAAMSEAMGKAEKLAIARLGYKTPSAFWTKVRRAHFRGKYGALGDAVEAAGKRAAERARTKLARPDFRRVIPVYLSIQRPLDAEVKLKRGTPWLAMAKKMFNDNRDAPRLLGVGQQAGRARERRLEDWKTLQDAIDDVPARISYPVIAGAGYDGVVHTAYYPDNEYRSWIAFDPRQIKHATENVGTYDPSDPSMYKNPRGKTSRRPR